jgi:hypothetical protein
MAALVLSLGRFQGCVHLRGCIFLHPGHDVRIQIECDANLAMPEPFAGNLGVNAGRQHVSCVGMAQVVKPDAGQGGTADEPDPFVRDESWLHWRAMPLTISVPEAGQKYFGLSRNGSYAAANRGEIPTIRVGKLLRVPVVAMEQLLLQSAQRPNEVAA